MSTKLLDIIPLMSYSLDMTTTQTATTAYRVRGTTDDVTTCQICGKPELKGTVILDILDEDGNTEEVTYAGTTCAAKLTGRKATAIRNAAAAADYSRQQALEHARKVLSWWGPIEGDRAAIRELYFKANPAARGTVNAPQRVAEILREAREVIAADGLA